MKLEPDQIIDNRYKVVEKLGEGGMGAVWLALDSKHGDEVVVKIPLNHLDAESSHRFGREAKAMRKHSLDCPNILNIEDVGMIDDVPWYVMRYLPGGSVRDRVLPRDESGAVEWTAESFDWLSKIAAALDYLHNNQAYHRDVKPENVLFSVAGTPYLVDFGIVKTVSETTSMVTEQGKAVGTMAYMAPETLDGEPFTSKSDQYSLAVTLYESITGDRPFSGTTFFALFKSIQNGHRKLAELSPAVPLLASQAVDRALSTDPEKRFESCRDFADAFISGLNTDMPVVSVSPVATAQDDDRTRKLGLRQYQQDSKTNLKTQAADDRSQRPHRPPLAPPVKPKRTTPYPLPTSLAVVLAATAAVILLGGGAAAVVTMPWSASARFELAEEYYYGTMETDGDRNTALSWYRKSAEAGHTEAQVKLAEILASGNEVTKDTNEAQRWYRLAIDSTTDTGAKLELQWKLGELYADKSSNEIELGIETLTRAANNNYRPAMKSLAGLYLDKKSTHHHPDEAKRWQEKFLVSLKEAAFGGDADAEYELAKIYDYGSGEVEEDNQEAIRWYSRAAEHGNFEAQKTIAYMLSEGYYEDDFEKSPKESNQWYHIVMAALRKRASAGDVDAQLQLADRYSEGDGVDVDQHEANQWYERAFNAIQNKAIVGDAKSQRQLGNLYSRGKAVTANTFQAKTWLKRAADQDDHEALFDIGFMYEFGSDFDKDHEKAKEWYLLAEGLGNSEARFRIDC